MEPLPPTQQNRPDIHHQPFLTPLTHQADDMARLQPSPLTAAHQYLRPVPVVRVLSPVGVEYVFLMFTLLIGAGSLVGALLTLVDSHADFTSLAFPVASLVVTVPLFALIFLHLKRLELRNPDLKLDPSKRRSTQVTQIVSFLVTLFTGIGFMFTVFASFGGQTSVSIGKAALNAICVAVVSGGILTYYWHDEHKTVR